MRALSLLLLFLTALGLSSCKPQSEESRSTQEAGGTLPWNRPQKWEGGGAMGSQMNEFSR